MLNNVMTPPSRNTRASGSTSGFGECCDTCLKGITLLFQKENIRRGAATEAVKGISRSLDEEAVQELPAVQGVASAHRHTGTHRGLGSSTRETNPKRAPSNATCPHTGFFAVHPPKHRMNNGRVDDRTNVAQECRTPVYSILKRTGGDPPGETYGSRDETSSEGARFTRDRVHSMLVPLRFDRNGQKINEHGNHHVSFNDTDLEKRTHPCESSFSPPSDPMSVPEFNRMRKWVWTQQRQRESQSKVEHFLTFRMRAMSI
ncbi:hypothetical protein Pmar_PMAR009187 [Perkinsus marinus ATCC 50983]|uniref:Uncharacterized protein n=1 Tax=Perkinsus marinus (strain ATCC 50983 / TXsc) TaxID=423536 RepID=C5LE13_PERM5|nr:hypothetical protein Pmar_PMAR009187 [Perkinsus marinus ATCC 50983]EER05011.1 hypothetical protein Pmar_PMAR009187 [Perkinsus marinus ATCC 50983]|eukprot:XP_002773195.1 hypothetical protein Pmar_PMAR009187 [Perkinsus marinus ATCC 50983]